MTDDPRAIAGKDRRTAKRALRHIEKAMLAVSGLPRIGSVSANLHSAYEELDAAILQERQS